MSSPYQAGHPQRAAARLGAIDALVNGFGASTWLVCRQPADS